MKMRVSDQLKSLAEAIIFQSLDDLSVDGHREESICFFEGEGFTLCASLAGMGEDEKKAVLDLSLILSVRKRPGKPDGSGKQDRGFRLPQIS